MIKALQEIMIIGNYSILDHVLTNMHHKTNWKSKIQIKIIIATIKKTKCKTKHEYNLVGYNKLDYENKTKCILHKFPKSAISKCNNLISYAQKRATSAPILDKRGRFRRKSASKPKILLRIGLRFAPPPRGVAAGRKSRKSRQRSGLQHQQTTETAESARADFTRQFYRRMRANGAVQLLPRLPPSAAGNARTVQFGQEVFHDRPAGLRRLHDLRGRRVPTFADLQEGGAQEEDPESHHRVSGRLRVMFV